jgi:hypothetical protein
MKKPMDFAAFTASLSRRTPPAVLSLALCALWWDAKGAWDKAHDCAQKQDDAAGAWVHAYLHRKEGDAANAGHWYRRAGKRVSTATLTAEWEAITRALLGEA